MSEHTGTLGPVAALVTGRVSQLNAALARVQAELPKVEKTRKADVFNKERVFLYSYMYADLADVSAAVMPLLGRNGLCFTALPGWELVQLAAEPERYELQFGIRYELRHESGEKIDGWYRVDPGGSEQDRGGRLTYARRYILSAVTGVAAEEDVDGRGGDGPPRRAARGAGSAEAAPARTAQRRTQAPAAQTAKAPAETGQSHSSPAPPVTTTSRPPLPGEDPDDGPSRRHLPSAPTSDASRDEPGTLSSAQLTKIQVIFGELGFTREQRAERLNLASRIAGRQLSSANDLSFSEARRLIDFIEQECGSDYPRVEAELIRREGGEGG
jgi:ERF superfamily